MKLEKIIWEDAGSFDKSIWRDYKEMKELMEGSVIVSIGMVIAENTEKLVIAGHINEADKFVLGEMMIPKKMIKSRKVLRG